VSSMRTTLKSNTPRDLENESNKSCATLAHRV
jgi:hypothetical protein